ncbi:TPA: hypothetical protein HA239_04610 [Candidatus Woesearchaeota archaeon]|nr:hypothetical protein QT06_C0001G0115 [archaeon GW2011_AR15]MBS3104080.1 hypothetical protein [Candidatus Woesearchaeota archaeon]HIH41672.1 hypothetical protein [Candidatus Woesearchaeota archaeon]
MLSAKLLEHSAMDFFYSMLERYARYGITPDKIEGIVTDEIKKEVEYWWQYYQEVGANPGWNEGKRELVLDIYTIWLKLDDLSGNLLEKTDYSTFYNWHQLKKPLQGVN